MKDLSIHISDLLRKHGCAIVPGFGGFVSNDMPARIMDNGKSIVRPGSIIGFNENLTLNDGLLIQSYMQKDDLSYAAAERKVRYVVKEMKDLLSAEGMVDIPSVGCIQSDMNGRLSFTAYNDVLVESKYYGLFDLELQLVADLKKKTTVVLTEKQNKRKEKLNLWGYAQYAAACVVVLILYFSSSVSIDNSSLHRYDNQASLIPATSLFVCPTVADVTVIEDMTEKTVTTDVSEQNETNLSVESSDSNDNKITENDSETKDAAVSIEDVKPNNRYHIVVASLNVSDDTDKMLKSLKDNGYSDAFVIESKNRIRVILKSYSNSEDAMAALKEVRKNASFKDAWVLNQKL